MQLSTRGLAIAAGLLWGGGILFVAIVQLAVPGYGSSFLQVVSSIYPGFSASGRIGDSLMGALVGFVDGAIAGFVFGWLYNLFSGRRNEV